MLCGMRARQHGDVNRIGAESIDGKEKQPRCRYRRGLHMRQQHGRKGERQMRTSDLMVFTASPSKFKRRGAASFPGVDRLRKRATALKQM